MSVVCSTSKQYFGFSSSPNHITSISLAELRSLSPANAGISFNNAASPSFFPLKVLD
jgi:hypothetical protein